MKQNFYGAALAALLLTAATPAPMPTPNFPNKPLHSTYEVEVNHLGQVVRVAHGTFSGDQAFDTMTLGNAMQMWIRRPDGSAETGLYQVRYDYNVAKRSVDRTPSLISKGGSWANAPGAATVILKDMKKQAQAQYARLKAEQKKAQEERAKHLPDINAAVKRAMKPSPSPQP
ncbi:MAG TPA: hypothetical protein VFL13_11125 [Candidatus Baltobacteraceae bacterium]|nr:hypothetical protein [Candidatus Baltobacteraceae bacterium]